MKIYVDGDAFVNLLKPILLKQIQRLKIKTIAVSNKKINLGKSDLIEYIIVEQGADEADHKIVELCQAGDLVITADIPLADRIVSKNAHAIDHRGELYTTENIKSLLAMRNLHEKLREEGVLTPNQKPYGQKDAEHFANSLNAFLNKNR